MRVIHDIIACLSEIDFSMLLFSRFESDTLISHQCYHFLMIKFSKYLIATITEFARENY